MRVQHGVNDWVSGLHGVLAVFIRFKILVQFEGLQSWAIVTSAFQQWLPIAALIYNSYTWNHIENEADATVYSRGGTSRNAKCYSVCHADKHAHHDVTSNNNTCVRCLAFPELCLPVHVCIQYKKKQCHHEIYIGSYKNLSMQKKGLDVHNLWTIKTGVTILRSQLGHHLAVSPAGPIAWPLFYRAAVIHLKYNLLLCMLFKNKGNAIYMYYRLKATLITTWYAYIVGPTWSGKDACLFSAS